MAWYTQINYWHVRLFDRISSKKSYLLKDKLCWLWWCWRRDVTKWGTPLYDTSICSAWGSFMVERRSKINPKSSRCVPQWQSQVGIWGKETWWRESKIRLAIHFPHSFSWYDWARYIQTKSLLEIPSLRSIWTLPRCPENQKTWLSYDPYWKRKTYLAYKQW